MPIDYAAEKFGNAIYSMVTSANTESPQDRVHSAAMITHTLDQDDFTSSLWQRFQKFQAAVTRVSDEQKGSFRASADALTDMEAHDLLVEFYNLAHDVEEEYRRSVSRKTRP